MACSVLGEPILVQLESCGWDGEDVGFAVVKILVLFVWICMVGVVVMMSLSKLHSLAKVWGFNRGQKICWSSDWKKLMHEL
jgi:hypothetical protein